MKTVQIAVIIFENKNEEILFLLRDKKKNIPFPDYWDLIGGHVEEGESPEEALKREVKEEIGYDLNAYSFFKRYNVVQGDAYHNVKFVFRALIDRGIDELELGDEGQKLRFFTYEEIPKLKLANVIKDIVSDYIKTK